MKAFPCEHPISGSMSMQSDGMDLRDYFAAKAMQGFILARDDSFTNKTVARWSYEMADAMMEARK
jgi:hypothetical protein